MPTWAQIVLYAVAMVTAVIALGALSQWAAKFWEDDE